MVQARIGDATPRQREGPGGRDPLADHSAGLARWRIRAQLRRMGVIAVDRSAASGVVDQVATMIRNAEGPLWVALAPEGTRRLVERWKPGFWKIAHQADVPVLPAYFHYPDKVIGIGPPITTSDDMAGDIERLRAWYRPWQGRHHGTP